MVNLCPNCGQQNPSGVEVCNHCTAPMTRACPSCGFENPAAFRFCGHCGSNLAAGAPRASSVARRPLNEVIPSPLAEKIARAGKQIEGERRTVAVLFADITGFTTISEKLDPEQVYQLVDSTFQAFVDEIYKHEGTVDRFLGDGVMALFGAPVTHEDDAARAVRAALGMQNALERINQDLEARLDISLKIRIGLNLGTVVVGSVGSNLRMEYTALGDTVNVASRLQTLAEPGTVLVSRAVFEQTQALFEFRELGSIRVKGRVEPVEIFEATAPREKIGRLRGIPGLCAPMVGRAEEFGRLRRVVDRLAEHGQGGLVLVTGEAGIGKSRLTTELRNYVAGKPLRVLEAACLSYNPIAYGVFLHLLRSFFEIADADAEEIVRVKVESGVRRIMPERAVGEVLPYIENLLSIRIVDKDLAARVRHLDPAALQQQTFLAVRDLMAAEARTNPLVLIFEDIHWIDRLSLDLITFLSGAVGEAPLLLYCNSRPGEGPAAPALLQLGSRMGDSAFLHLPLAPLSYADSVALVDLLLTVAELPEALKELIPHRAEGNPFYLEEIIRMLIDRGAIHRAAGRWQVAPDANWSRLDVPQTLQALLMARVDHLSAGARRVLQYASVVGRDFPYRLLRAVVEDVRDLMDSVRELEERELVHRIPESADLQYRFHHVLIQETVYHSLLIRRRERIHHQVAEGLESLFKGRLEEHVEQLAFHYSESQDSSRALPYLIRAGRHAAERFANAPALEYYRRAADALTRINATLEQRAEVHQGLGQVQNFVGDYDAALSSYVLALELVRAVGGESGARASAGIMRSIGRVHENRGDYAEALRWWETGLTTLDLDPQSRQAVERARIYNDIGRIHYRRGQFEEAYHWRMRGLQIVEGTDYYDEIASTYNGLVGLFTRQGDWARAIAYAEKGLRLREMIGDSHGVSASHNNLGSIALEQCDWAGAQHHFERSLEIKRRIGDNEGIARVSTNLAMVCRDQGDYDRAAELGRSALSVAESIKNGASITQALNSLAHIKILQGQIESAREDLTRSMAMATEMGHRERVADAQRLMAEALLAQEKFDEAEHCAGQACRIASEIGRQFVEGEALRTLARIARRQQQWEDAADYIHSSLRLFDSLHNAFETAKSDCELALLERDRADVLHARTRLESALATFDRLGAAAESRRARSELAALTRPAPRPVPISN